MRRAIAKSGKWSFKLRFVSIDSVVPTARATVGPSIGYLQELVADAVAKGALVANASDKGGTLAKTLLTPAVVYPVTKEMRLFQEEQFGPVVPVATYSDIKEVYSAIRDSWNGQQASVFTKNGETAAPLVDLLANTVCRININCQCGRSPDVIPFAGRRSSAMGTMSISGALREFSVETALVYASKSEESAAVAKASFEVRSRAAFRPAPHREVSSLRGARNIDAPGAHVTEAFFSNISVKDFLYGVEELIFRAPLRLHGPVFLQSYRECPRVRIRRLVLAAHLFLL
jgi:hypothetical protein